MFGHLLGIILAFGVVIGPILVMGGDKAIFVSVEGLIIVMGGTVAIALIAYPLRQVTYLAKVVLVIVRREPDSGPAVAREIVELSLRTRGDRNLLQSALGSIRFPFLRDSVGLIVDRIDDDLESILRERIRLKEEEDGHIAAMVRKLGSFPPALGLLATVLALVHLLQSMGTGETGMQNLGPSMAIGLVGTLYGIVFSNLVFAPIAENLAIKSRLDIRNREMVLIGAALLAARKSPVVVQEAVNSLLLIHQRVDVLGGGGAGTRSPNSEEAA